MRLVNFRSDQQTSVGVLVEGRIVDLGRHMPEYASIRSLLEADALVRALDTAAEVSASHRLDGVTLLPPVPNPSHLLCIFDEPDNKPVLIDPKFLRGPDRTLPIPAGAVSPLAAGVALVLGPSSSRSAGTRSVRIAGISLMIYLSPGALSTGPWVVTPDELEGLDELELTVTVGERSAALAAPACQAVFEQINAQYELIPGDLIGVLQYLPDMGVSTGEKVELHSDDIGTLENAVRSED
jgi:hypothetical protein